MRNFYYFNILFFFIFISQNKAQAPNWAWAQVPISTGNCVINNTTTDRNGNVYVTGNFSDTVTFGSFSLFGGNNSNGFVAKLNSLGQVLWVKQSTNTGCDIQPLNVRTDDNNNVYVSGWTYPCQVVFDTFNYISNEALNIFLVKYDSNGNFMWGRHTDNIGLGGGFSPVMAIDNNSNIILTAYFGGTINIGSYNFSSPNVRNILYAKYDQSGNLIWAKAFLNLNTNSYCSSIATDNTGNIYFTGFYENFAVVFGNDTLPAPMNGGIDAFVVKCSPSGNVLWTRHIGGSQDDGGTSIATNATGKVFLTGAFKSPSITFDSFTLINPTSNKDRPFIVQLDSLGVVDWAQSVTASSSNAVVASSVATNSLGNLIVSGGQSSSPVITIGGLTSGLISNSGPNNMYIAELNSTGSALWVKTLAGGGFLGGNSVVEGDIAIDSLNNIYISKFFSNPTLIVGSDTLVRISPSGSPFIAKLGENTICPLPVIEIGNDTTLCTGQTLSLIGGNATTYLWSNNSTTASITVSAAGTYWLRATNSCGFVTDTIHIIATANPTVNLGNDTTLCQGQTLTLALNIPSATYEWQDGNTNNTYPVMQQGIYAVEASSNGCISRDTILVNFDTPAMLDLGADTTLCSGQILTLSVANTNANLLWQDNSTNNSFTVNQQGIYWLNAANSCGLNSDTIQVNYAAAPALALGNDTSLCQGQTLNLDVNTSNVISYLWLDSVAGATYNITQQGTYWVALASNCGIVSDTIQVNFNATPFVNLGNDTTLCPGQNITLDVSDAAIDSYHWQDNSSAATFNINQQGSYYVDVLNNCGVASDTIHVTYDGLPFVYLGNDTTLCDGNTLLLNASTNNATYQWQDNSTNATFAISQQGLYWVNAIAVCGIVSDTIQVNYNPAPVVNLGNDTTLCLGQNLSLDATLSNATYLWQDNDSSPTYNITQQGTYWLNVTLNNCTTRDSIIVNYNNALPVVDLGNDTTLCEGQSITLDASSPSATYLWQDNSTLPTLIATQQGTYLIQVANGCGVAIDSIHLYMNQLPQLALSTIISPSCYGLSNGSATVTAQGTGVLTYVWNAGLANGPIINQVSSGTYSVVVYDANGCSNAMNVTINEPDSIRAIITSINATCAINNGSAQINASGGTGTLTYLWNNNSSSSSISELSEGNYAVIVTDSMACVKILQTSITQSGIFSIDAGVDQEINYGSTVELVGLGPESATYSWSPIDYLTCSECATTIANPVLTTEYILTVLKDGCIVTDTLIVKVDVKCGDVFIPSAFSPNSDDVNNILEVRGNCITQFSFKVFDRWGEIIFESNDQNTGWDGTFKGKPMNEGVYIYTLAAIVKGENIFQKGNVTLMRN